MSKPTSITVVKSVQRKYKEVAMSKHIVVRGCTSCPFLQSRWLDDENYDCYASDGRIVYGAVARSSPPEWCPLAQNESVTVSLKLFEGDEAIAAFRSSPERMKRLAEILKINGVIPAIRYVRGVTGSSLPPAKNLVQAVRDELKEG